LFAVSWTPARAERVAAPSAWTWLSVLTTTAWKSAVDMDRAAAAKLPAAA